MHIDTKKIKVTGCHDDLDEVFICGIYEDSDVKKIISNKSNDR